MDSENRHDPFGDDEFLGEVAAFEKIAQARGFDNRTAVSKPAKEPLKPLQFRLPESEVNAFRQRAYQEFGPGQGAIVSLFRKIWKDYQDSNA